MILLMNMDLSPEEHEIAKFTKPDLPNKARECSNLVPKVMAIGIMSCSWLR